MNTKTPYILVLIAVLLWSTGGVFIKWTTLGPYEVNFGRSLFAAITVGLFLLVKKELKFDWFSLVSGLFYAGTLSAFVYANKYTTAANAIFLQYTAPIYILLLAPLILGEKFRLKDAFTVLVCLGGMSLFFLDSSTTSDNEHGYSGLIAGLIAGFCLGMYFISLRHPRSLKLDPAVSVLTGNVIIVVVAMLFLIEEIPSIGRNDVVSLVFLGVIQIGLAYIFFTKGVAEGVRSLEASIIGFVEPLLNPIWVVIFLGEQPSKWTIIGGAIIISGVLFHTLKTGYETHRQISSEQL